RNMNQPRRGFFRISFISSSDCWRKRKLRGAPKLPGAKRIATIRLGTVEKLVGHSCAEGQSGEVCENASRGVAGQMLQTIQLLREAGAIGRPCGSRETSISGSERSAVADAHVRRSAKLAWIHDAVQRIEAELGPRNTGSSPSHRRAGDVAALVAAVRK